LKELNGIIAAAWLEGRAIDRDGPQLTCVLLVEIQFPENLLLRGLSISNQSPVALDEVRFHGVWVYRDWKSTSPLVRLRIAKLGRLVCDACCLR